MLNIEFKAKSENNARLEDLLKKYNPRYAGLDHQIDIYFNVSEGRLKLREGNIENALIFYKRLNVAGAKQSEVQLLPLEPGSPLKEMLIAANGIKVVVDKQRKIYFIDNVKIHFDEVAGLGDFVEVEAIDIDGSIGLDKLQEQCDEFSQLFGIKEEDFMALSYSDLLLEKKSSTTS